MSVRIEGEEEKGPAEAGPFVSLLEERAMGLEPTTLSLGS
jgi:hypothetical protein